MSGQSEDLTDRETLALKLIHQCRRDSVLRQSPTHRELMRLMNEWYEAENKKAKVEKFALLVSPQQTHRLAVSLRAKGYLVEGEGVEGMHRNLSLSNAGERKVRTLSPLK